MQDSQDPAQDVGVDQVGPALARPGSCAGGADLLTVSVSCHKPRPVHRILGEVSKDRTHACLTHHSTVGDVLVEVVHVRGLEAEVLEDLGNGLVALNAAHCQLPYHPVVGTL